jgi:hypothetical protein
MKRLVSIIALACALAAPAAAHETPPAPAAAAETPELATPPAIGAETLVITSTGGNHGQLVRWTAPDGTRWARESLLLRGFKSELDQQTRLAADGTIEALTIRGTTPSGDAAESFRFAGGRYSYQSPVDKGEAAASGASVYVPYGGLFEPTILLAEALYKAPGRTLALAPSGRATLNPLTTLEVSNGTARKTLAAYTIDGVSTSPVPIWFDGDRVFGSASFLNFLPKGWEAVAPC